MNSPDVRFLAWSIFALALSLPLTAWMWSRNETRPAPQAIVIHDRPPAPPVAPAPLQQSTRVYEGVPVAFMDAVFYPQSNGAEVKFTVNRDAWVTLNVVGPDGAVVRSLGSARVPSGVGQTAFWDGNDDSDRPAPLRHYALRMSAQAGNGTTVITKPIDLPNRQNGR